MVLLLAVGLAAVIIVILIAVFLSVRLGRSDDREEPTGRSSERSEERADTDESRWRDERAPQRPSTGVAGPGRSRPRPEAGDRPYRDRGNRRPERDQAARSGDYDYPQRPGRYDTGPVEQPTDPRRLAHAGARRGGPRRDNGTRRAGARRGRPEAAPAPYDTGPSLHPAADEFPSGPQGAAVFPSEEYPSRPQPAADFPSGGFPPAAPAAAGTPHAGYHAAGDSGEFPPVPPSADFASGEFAAADFPSDEFAAADFPSGEMPAARGRGKSAPPKVGRGHDGPDKRRKSGKGQGAAKGRSRQQRKRDDDDWPSTDWDKLTDEQYWEQLSSDKPLATTARSTPPAGKPTPATAGNGQSRPAAVRATPPASQPAPSAAGHARGRDLSGRNGHSPPREAANQPREAAPRREAATQAREALTQPHEAPARRQAMTPPRETAPRREAMTQPQAAARREAAAERLPGRPRQQPSSAQPRNGTPLPVRPDTTATPPDGEPSLAMLASLAHDSVGAFDDPLTSPSFSGRAPDSRSYRGDRANGGTGGGAANGSSAAPVNGYANGGYGNGGYGNGGYAHGGPDHRTPANGMYQVPDYTDPGHAYAPAAPQSRSAGAPRPAEWHSAPTYAPARSSPAQSPPPQSPPPQSPSARSAPARSAPAQGPPALGTPPQGNPYGSYVEPAPTASYPSTPPMGYQDPLGAGLPAYPNGRGRHQQSAYDPAASRPYSAPTPAGAGRIPVQPSDAEPVPSRGAHRKPGYAEDGGYRNGYPGQAPHPDPTGYPPGSPAAAGYGADHYRPDGYGGYPLGQG